MAWKKALLVAGGAAASALIQGIAGTKGAHNAAVQGLARCMDISDGIQSAAQSVLDEAEDLRAEAKLQRRIDAAVAEKIAAIEDEVREEVRAAIEEAYAEDWDADEEPLPANEK